MICQDMRKNQIIAALNGDIELNESRLNNIYQTPLTEGGMGVLIDNVDNITFCEDEIASDLDEIDIWEEEDETVKDFFGIKPHNSDIQ